LNTRSQRFSLFGAKTLSQCEAILFFERLDAPDQFRDLRIAFGDAGFEVVDIDPGRRRQSERVVCAHAFHDSEARHRTGLRRFVTVALAVVYRQQPSRAFQLVWTYRRFGWRRTTSMSMPSSSQCNCSVVSSITACCRRGTDEMVHLKSF